MQSKPKRVSGRSGGRGARMHGAMHEQAAAYSESALGIGRVLRDERGGAGHREQGWLGFMDKLFAPERRRKSSSEPRFCATSCRWPSTRYRRPEGRRRRVGTFPRKQVGAKIANAATRAHPFPHALANLIFPQHVLVDLLRPARYAELASTQASDRNPSEREDRTLRRRHYASFSIGRKVLELKASRNRRAAEIVSGSGQQHSFDFVWSIRRRFVQPPPCERNRIAICCRYGAVRIVCLTAALRAFLSRLLSQQPHVVAG